MGYKFGMIITLDGPAGSGKSTAARELAKALGVAHLDTGATYRAVTLAALRRGVDFADEAALADLTARLDVRLERAGDRLRVLLDGEDVSDQIRSAAVSDNSHHVAAAPAVRKLLVALQRKMGEELARRTGGVVAEGRDQGSVVFPDAEVKFYLDAAPQVRAKRRLADLLAAGEQVNYEDVLAAILTRDRRDSTRPVDPMIKPAGAIEIDTTATSVEQVTAELVRHVRGAK